MAERDTIISCLRLFGSPSYHAAEFAAVMFYPALSSRQARQSMQSMITSSELLSLTRHPSPKKAGWEPGSGVPPGAGKPLGPKAGGAVPQAKPGSVAVGATPITVCRCGVCVRGVCIGGGGLGGGGWEEGVGGGG
jgi:hypothetical protein